jgi:hypothetical protein
MMWKWMGKRLRAALDEVGKERIKDLAQNPLRLTLLCNIWQREQGLPDTQAGLYERFVSYVYSWSKVQDAEEMQLELDQVMGILAKYGINKPSLRFRFTERELQEQVPDISQRKVLKALGWLNCVGVDESDQKVYAFFHTTFQEYFAACSIKDWDYFLPREHDDQPVPCQDEEMPTYRVFAKHWEQTILLWFGREDLEDKLKKDEFIEKLTNFQAGCENSMYHYFLAYQIAVIGVGEFNSSQRESLFNENIEFAFGQYNPQTDQWRDYLDCFQYSARATIYLMNPKHAIERLRSLLSRPNLDSYRRNDIEKALKQITKQNKQDTYLYPQYLEKYKPLPLYQYNNTKSNQQTVEEAIAQLNKPIIKSIISNSSGKFSFPLVPAIQFHYRAISTLGKAESDEQAIKALITFLSRDCQELSGLAIEALGKITKSKESTIKGLINLLKSNDVEYFVCTNVFMALSEIITKSEMPLVVSQLREYITTESGESNPRRFEDCQTIMFHCAQTLSYHEFHKAWHQLSSND